MAQLLGQPGTSRAVVVKGLRTPFVKAGTASGTSPRWTWGGRCPGAGRARGAGPGRDRPGGVRPGHPHAAGPNIAREVVLAAGLPAQHRGPHRVPRLRHLHPGDHRRRQRDRARPADVAIAGGAETLSDVPIFASRPLAQRPGGLAARPSRCRKLGPSELKPEDLDPGAARHRRALHRPHHGRERGEDGQGERHLRARSRTSSRWPRHQQRGRGAGRRASSTAEVMHVPRAARATTRVADQDNIVRADTSLDALAELEPVFDRQLRHRHRRQRLAAHRRRRRACC